jgi:rare lipoprotein A
MRVLRPAALAAVLLVLAACSTAPRHGSARITLPPPSGTVPDAVPRAEPRSSHGNPPFYEVYGQRYQVRASADNYVERGVASWYGPDFQGHDTSSGERYDMYGMTAAHKTLPIPCYARITNLSNGRSVVVRINDRGPFVANRIVDLSYSAATRLDVVRTGTAFVELRTVGPGEQLPAPAPTMVAATPEISTTPAVPTPLPAAVPVATPVAVAAPPAVPPAVAAPATASVALYIQVGAFADPGNAQRVVDRLQSAGVAHVFSVASTGSGQVLRRVRVGPIGTVEEFDQLATQLATLGYPEARLAND